MGADSRELKTVGRIPGRSRCIGFPIEMAADAVMLARQQTGGAERRRGVVGAATEARQDGGR